jgi:hypothetical protein
MGRNNTYLSCAYRRPDISARFQQNLDFPTDFSWNFKDIRPAGYKLTDMKLMGVLYATMRTRTLLKNEKILQPAVLNVTADGV